MLRGGSFSLLVVSLWAFLLAPLGAWGQLDRYYYYRTAVKHVSRGQYTAAISTLNGFLRAVPDDAVGLHIRAWAKYSLEDYRGAIVDLDSALAHRPFMADALLLRAACRNRVRQSAAALSDVALAMELRPNDRGALGMRGVTRFLLRDYEGALSDFLSSVRLQPGHLESRLHLGACYLQLGDTVGAVGAFEGAIRANPYSVQARVSLARISWACGRLGEAMGWLDGALRLDPSGGEALMIRALVLHDSGRRQEALGVLDQVVAMSPGNSLALYNRALMRAEGKDYRGALRDYEAALAISPTNVLLLYNAGLLHELLGHPRRGEESLTRAIGVFPTFAQAYRARGHLRLVLGDRAGAASDLDSARSLSARYRDGALDRLHDTSARLSRLIGFESDFTRGASGAVLSVPGVVEVLPMATIAVGQSQRHTEWRPVQRADSVCGAPFFSLVVRCDDTSQRVDVSRFPPLKDSYGLLVGRGVSLYEESRFDSADSLLSRVPERSALWPLARYMRAACLVARGRYGSVDRVVLSGGDRASVSLPDYGEALGMLDSLGALYPSAYLEYSRGFVLYLSRDLEGAEWSFTRAIGMEPGFGESYYNRGLVRLLRGDHEGACYDLSRAGELGIDAAYRAISRHCSR